MSLSEDEAGIYARNLVELQLDRDRDAAVLRKAVADVVAKGVPMSDAAVQNQAVQNQMVDTGLIPNLFWCFYVKGGVTLCGAK